MTILDLIVADIGGTQTFDFEVMPNNPWELQGVGGNPPRKDERNVTFQANGTGFDEYSHAPVRSYSMKGLPPGKYRAVILILPRPT